MEHCTIPSPCGPLTIYSSDVGITKITIQTPEQSNSETDHPILLQCMEQLQAYFNGELTEFDVPLDFGDASEFYQDVWKSLMLIPFGKTRSYFDVAKLLGNPKAVRAVGLANGKNPIPIIVPCHRVIGKDGSLVGYALGLDMKTQLLHLENPAHFNKQGTLFAA